MKLVSFVQAEGKPRVGIVEGDAILSPAAGSWNGAATLGGLFAADEIEAFATAARAGERIAIDEITYLPPVFDPPRIFCIGVNYEEHRVETGRERAKAPIIFMRLAQSQVGHGVTIEKPAISDKFDYEGEIAIVIGKGGRNISREKAMEHVFGYSAYNDVSVRDWQMHTGQWTPGKNFDGCGSFGPWLITADEMPANRADITIETRLNGAIMQQGNGTEMIFSIEEQIEYISTFTALLPGDVIATGTPGGVGTKRNPQVFMKPGDLVEIEVGGVGILSNRIG